MSKVLLLAVLYLLASLIMFLVFFKIFNAFQEKILTFDGSWSFLYGSCFGVWSS